MAESQPCVQVTLHAVERWRERGGRGRDGFDCVKKLAEDAIAAGRKAKRKPRWVCNGGFRSRLNEANKRYLWDEDERFCLVAVLNKKCWHILTVMSADS